VCPLKECDINEATCLKSPVLCTCFNISSCITNQLI
jgi:hypothetical protein